MIRSRLRVGSVEWNQAQWSDDSVWGRDGDDWTFHADTCGQPYDIWKQSLVEEFLKPFLGPQVDFVEIGPGQGRWTEFMVGNTHSLTLVDLSPKCINVCRQRFGHHGEVSFVANDGRSLPVPSGSTDIVWSFGSFVHFDPGEVDAYLAECGRVLKKHGRFVIHHAGWAEWSLRTVPITRHLGRPGRVLQHRLGQGRWRPGGDRAPMSENRFASLATRHGLDLDTQIRTWGPANEFGLAFNDVISMGFRAASERETAMASL